MFSFGQKGQVYFRDHHEYYFALGFLANSTNAEICWENNEDAGAWGSEGRILCHVPERCFPDNFLFTAGRGDIYARVNCNDFVGRLVTVHNFSYNTRFQNVSKILETVPDQYREDFISGYGGSISYMPPFTGVQDIMSTYRRTPTSSRTRSTVSSRRTITAISVQRGDKVYHKKYGNGTVLFNDGKTIRVEFSDTKKVYIVPDSFENGILKKL